MPPVAPFKYDVLISYSSTDRPWAKQLADDLAARNLKVFHDRTSLDAGDPEKIVARGLKGYPNVPPGQIEVWIASLRISNLQLKALAGEGAR